MDIKPEEEGSLLSSILHPQDGSEPVEYPRTEGIDAKVSENIYFPTGCGNIFSVTH